MISGIKEEDNLSVLLYERHYNKQHSNIVEAPTKQQ